MNLHAGFRAAEDGESRELTWFRATSEAKDRHGTIIETKGADVEPFLRNPIV